MFVAACWLAVGESWMRKLVTVEGEMTAVLLGEAPCALRARRAAGFARPGRGAAT